MRFSLETQVGFFTIGSAIIAITIVSYDLITFNIPSEQSLFVYTFGSILLIFLGLTFIQDAKNSNIKTV